MEKLYSYFKDGLRMEISHKQKEQFEKYYQMLIEKNKVMNLTAITEKQDVELKHFIDSLVLGEYINLKQGNPEVIDVGTGAGFPGIPLKIAFPNLNMTLYDSLNKRIKFLQEVIDELGLSCEATGGGKCVAIHGRAEEGGRDSTLREQFDIVLSRAVANMSVLAEYALPFVKVGGYFIPYKTEEVDGELSQGKKAVDILGGRIEKIERLTLPESDIGRSLVFIKKQRNTPKQYPRKAGTASKQPLI